MCHECNGQQRFITRTNAQYFFEAKAAGQARAKETKEEEKGKVRKAPEKVFKGTAIGATKSDMYNGIAPSGISPRKQWQN